MFSDLQNHWSASCILKLAEKSIIQGYPDGRVYPDRGLTRAELAVLMVKAFPDFPLTQPTLNFSDLSSSHWAYSVIQTAVQKGFFRGYPDTTFKPSQPVTKLQAILVLGAALINQQPYTPLCILNRSFVNADAIPNFAQPIVAQATLTDLIVNYPNSQALNPNRDITRGEVAALFCQGLDFGEVPTQYQVKLTLLSEQQVDYTPLQTELIAQNWREANRLTSNAILDLGGQRQRGYLTASDTQNLPCFDIQTIDLLWLKYSQGRFGLSRQAEIWRNLQGKDYEDSLRFEQQVRWNQAQPVFDLTAAPPGHLPLRPALSEGVMDAWGGMWILAISQRLEDCC
ncbi:MAG: GUN4 domain-containing protein [Cyanobacteria bacterium J06592_8]